MFIYKKCPKSTSLKLAGSVAVLGPWHRFAPRVIFLTSKTANLRLLFHFIPKSTNRPIVECQSRLYFAASPGQSYFWLLKPQIYGYYFTSSPNLHPPRPVMKSILPPPAFLGFVCHSAASSALCAAHLLGPPIGQLKALSLPLFSPGIKSILPRPPFRPA